MTRRIASIVEGYGEVEALPVVLRRLLHEKMECFDVDVLPPWRLPKSAMLNRSGELQRVAQANRIKAGPDGLVLLLIDADDDLPCVLAPDLQRQLRAAVEPPHAVVVACSEFETWFLASAEALAGSRGLPTDLVAPDAPESIRDAKGWLKLKLPHTRPYSPTSDQAAYAARIDLDAAREKASSFDKLWREIARWARTD